MSPPVGPYSPLVRVGEWLICSGQLGLRNGTLVLGGVREQAAQALVNLQGLLEGEGVSMRAVVKTTVFLTHMADYGVLNHVYAEAFGDHRPARSVVGATALPLGAVVEIEAWAYNST